MATRQKFKLFAIHCGTSRSPTRSLRTSLLVHLWRRISTLSMLLGRRGGIRRRREPMLQRECQLGKSEDLARRHSLKDHRKHTALAKCGHNCEIAHENAIASRNYYRVGIWEIRIVNCCSEMNNPCCSAWSHFGTDCRDWMVFNLVNWKHNEEKAVGGDGLLLRHIQEQFKSNSRKSESAYHVVTDVAILRFMVEVCWGPMLAAFSVTLDQSNDRVATSLCSQGFRHVVHVTAVMGMQTQRDAFVTPVAKFTCLHCAGDMTGVNMLMLLRMPQVMQHSSVHLNLLDQIGIFELNHAFAHSQRLNGEAIVAFVKALCKVSISEKLISCNLCNRLPATTRNEKREELANYNFQNEIARSSRNSGPQLNQPSNLTKSAQKFKLLMNNSNSVSQNGKNSLYLLVFLPSDDFLYFGISLNYERWIDHHYGYRQRRNKNRRVEPMEVRLFAGEAAKILEENLRTE
ncbi:Brefeldin A-inhibited guanine nucleotide-exchange protein 2 [Sesbania bispinosa]|nr:Brefeldin A-inhibited guanine nucleotide-exchange protein 2 [Sesbania bispinosa]